MNRPDSLKLARTLPPLASLLPFEAAARLESFSRAALELNLTQAAISRQIRALEQDLGVRLFERRNRAVFLTEAGQSLARVISNGLGGIAGMAVELRGAPQHGEVVLFSQLCEALYWVMPRLTAFERAHPAIRLRLVSSTRPLTEFPDHFDVAMQTSGRASGSHLRVFSVADEVFPVCAPHLLANLGGKCSLADILQQRLLHHRANPQDWIDWDGWLAHLGVETRIGHKGSVFDSYPLMVQAAVEGHGIALGWHSTMQRLLASGSLVRPIAESVRLGDELSVYTRAGSRPRPEVKALLAWLRAELAMGPTGVPTGAAFG